MSKKGKSIRVKLITNPSADVASNAADHLKLVTGYLTAKNLKVDVAFAKPKEGATAIAKRAVKNGYKIVVAMGGDGTIEAVMHGMVGGKARMGIIPTGTENNIAKSLGIPTNLEEACALVVTDNTLKLDLGQVTTRKGKKFVFFEMVTIGLSAAIYPDASKIASGKLSSLKATAMTFIHQETKPSFFLTLDDESKIEVETMLMVVSNTPVFGRNFEVAPDASMQDGLLDVSVYPDFSKAELLRYYADVMDGGYSGDGKVQHYQARKLKIKTSPPLDVMADGIALGKGTVIIKVRPGALRVITVGKTPSLENTPKDEAISAPAEQPKSKPRTHSMPVSQTVETNHHKSSVISQE